MKKTVLLLISALLFLLGSCSSLPLPGTYSESLLVIPVEMDRDLGSKQGKRRSITMAYLDLINIETGKKKKLTLIPGKNSYISVTVEPGRYQLGEELILSLSQTPGSDSWQNREALHSRPMLIEKSIVYISPLVLTIEGSGNGEYKFSYYHSSSSEDPGRKEIYEQLISERRFKAWELYQLVGWDTEE